MRKTFQYRIYGNQQTLHNAEHWLDLCRNLYNVALEQRINIYKQNKGNTNRWWQQKQLPELKEEFPEYKQVNGQVLQDVIFRLYRTYESFFERVKHGEKAGYPRFKSKDRYNSFTMWQWGWKLDGKYLTVTNVGRFKLKLSRPIEGDIKTVSIKRKPTGKWFAYFSCDNVSEKPLTHNVKECGIDVGLESFLTDSEGIKVEHPTYLNKSCALLRRRHRRLDRRVKGSNGRNKARILLTKAYENVTNQRHDFAHKVANKYIANYGAIYIEDLLIDNMMRNHNLSRSIRDSSWGYFFKALSDKAESANRIVLRVRHQNTSQRCSKCGEIVAKKLRVRIHSCPFCGLVIDRDFNSALNILKDGQSLLAKTSAGAGVASESLNENVNMRLRPENLSTPSLDN